MADNTLPPADEMPGIVTPLLKLMARGVTSLAPNAVAVVEQDHIRVHAMGAWHRFDYTESTEDGSIAVDPLRGKQVLLVDREQLNWIIRGLGTILSETYARYGQAILSPQSLGSADGARLSARGDWGQLQDLIRMCDELSMK